MRNLIEKIETALNNKQDQQLRKDIAKIVGYFEEKSNRYHIEKEFITESSMNVRAPSRAWPFSEYKHAMTDKYLKQLKVKLETI